MLNKCFNKNNRQKKFEFESEKTRQISGERRIKTEKFENISFNNFSVMQREINLHEHLLSLDKSSSLTFVQNKGGTAAIKEVYEVNVENRVEKRSSGCKQNLNWCFFAAFLMAQLLLNYLMYLRHKNFT